MNFDPTYNPYSLVGKTILITGASSGIGSATAIECAKLGAKCVITGRNEERLENTFAQLEGEGHSKIIVDLSTNVGVELLVDLCPILDGVVANAGYTQTTPINFIKEEKLQGILQVNTISSILLLKTLLKKKKLSKGTSVVYTCSLSGLGRVSIGNSMYAASKGALHAFAKAAANELADKQSRVNTVCPAMVETNILDAGTITSEQIEIDKLKYPLKRYGRPNEVAWAIIYLLSDAAAWVTGTDMILDGGKLLR